MIPLPLCTLLKPLMRLRTEVGSRFCAAVLIRWTRVLFSLGTAKLAKLYCVWPLTIVKTGTLATCEGMPHVLYGYAGGADK
jgi:hypothetical protein